MNNLPYVLTMLLALVLCIANVYSMHTFRISMKKLILAFSVVMLICNACLVYFFGSDVFQNIMLATIAVPFFVLFLIIAEDRISQVFFSYWLWVNIYVVITNLAKLVNDLTLRNNLFKDSLIIFLLGVHLILFNVFLKLHYRRFLETPNINWWVFSLIPLFFEILIVTTNKAIPAPDGFTRNYAVLFVVFLLMIVVYALIIYTIRITYTAAKSNYEKEMYTQQLDAARVQIDLLNKAHMQTALYRHNMRHNMTAIDALLAVDNVEQARDYIKETVDSVDALTLRHFCENDLVDLLCSAFCDKAERDGIRLSVDAKLPDKLNIPATELCALLSNGLENALNTVSKLSAPDRWAELYCSIRANKLLIEIRNPYHGEITIKDGLPVTDREGHGYGCRSIRSIAEHNKGMCVFEPNNGIFTLRIVMPMS